MPNRTSITFALALLGLGYAACGGVAPGDGLTGGDASGSDAGAAQGTPGSDSGGTAPGSDSGGSPGNNDAGGPSTHDASTPPGADASLPPDPTDGTPNHSACTTGRGTGISGTSYGRLDGYVAAIKCLHDTTHLHLQIRMNNEMYDIAINLDTLYTQKDTAMPDGAWSEGWHTGISVDYPTTFGVHAADFTLPASQSALELMLEQELANANHVSIFGTGYATNDGAHDIHRKPRGSDGAIVIDPLSPTAHILLFRFSTDSF